MEKFVPKENLGKKQKRRLAAQKRAMWTLPPVTKVVESKKVYSRKRKPRDRYDDGAGFLSC